MGDDSYTYEYYSSSSSEKAPKKKEKEKEKNSTIQVKEKEREKNNNNNREKEVPAPKPIIKTATTKNPVYAKPLPELKKKNEDRKEDKKESKVQKDVKPKEQLNKIPELIKPSAPQEDFSKEFANAKKLAEEEAANTKQNVQQADNAIGAGKQDETDYYSDYSDSYYSEYYSEEETEQDRDNKRLLEFAKQIPTMKTDYNNLNFIYRSCIEANGSNEYTPAQLVFLDALIARMNELKGKK